MKIELPKSVNQKPGKVIEIDITDNFKKPITCPQCGNGNFEGFSTGYGPYRRCLDVKCRYEWPCGGISAMVMMSSEEKEALREFHNNMTQDEAYNKAVSIADDLDRLEEVRHNEKMSGSNVNRSFWNEYLRQWDDLGE